MILVVAPKSDIVTPHREDDDMGRHRGQRTGSLTKKGGSWFLRWREYAPGEKAGRQCSEAIAPCTGLGALTKRQAQRLAWDEYLSKLDQRTTRPLSTMTLDAFIAQKFTVQVAEKKKPSTRKHYAYIVRKFIQPAVGHRRLCDITRDDVEILIADMLKKFSPQTAHHVKNAVSRIFGHAKALSVYAGENPATGVDCGELIHDKRPSFSWANALRALEALPSPIREMCWLSVETSMNAAELCGLRRKWANLSADIRQVDGEILAPFTIGVRENWYEGQRGSLKRGKRRRNCPITRELARDLEWLILDSGFQGEDFPVFCSGLGTPVDAHNASNRVFAPLALKLGFPITWHAWRRAHSTFAGQIYGISIDDRVKTMGHADASSTLYYSIDDIERRRAIPDQIRARLNALAQMRSATETTQ